MMMQIHDAIPHHDCIRDDAILQRVVHKSRSLLHMLAWAALFFYFYAMAKTREVFICSACGAQTLQWRGQCPGCHEWNTLQAAAQPKALSRSTSRVSVPAGNRPVPLQDVAETGHHPYPSGIASLDRVLGKGLVPGAAILIGGEPGIGKSTLLLQVAGLVAAQGGRVLYASGEESLPQIKARGQRLGMLHDNLLAMSTSSVDEVIAALELAPPRLLVVDSVQTMSSVDAEGLPGNVNQVRAVSMALLEACRRLGVTLVLVGHVTKDGVLAGPRLLEHMVDTVISLEGDRRQMFRLLRVFKNRFGPNEELLVFRMGGRGMEVVDDPSTFFLGDRDASLSGTAVVMAVDGPWWPGPSSASPGVRPSASMPIVCICCWPCWKSASSSISGRWTSMPRSAAA